MTENGACKEAMQNKMTRDGANRKAMQNKLRDHSNIVVLVKTDENKIFGGYTSFKIEYNHEAKHDNKAFLFSIDLNNKLNIKENKYAICDNKSYAIYFGNCDLALFDNSDGCYSSLSGSRFSNYETNGIKRDKFCGGMPTNKKNHFKPIEIEVFEINEEQNEQENIKRRNEDNEANKKNKKS